MYVSTCKKTVNFFFFMVLNMFIVAENKFTFWTLLNCKLVLMADVVACIFNGSQDVYSY